MITIRPATKKDIPFIIKGILEIEQIGNTNTYNQLFSTHTEQTIEYLTQIFEDEENLHTELSLGSFIIAEENDTPAGCCCLIYTTSNYYLSKSELFPIHLSPEHLSAFIKKASTLPDHRNASSEKHFVEYIFVDEPFRRKGIAEKMIAFQLENIQEKIAYINVFETKTDVANYYKKLGFSEYTRVAIDTPENTIYPAERKIILMKAL